MNSSKNYNSSSNKRWDNSDGSSSSAGGDGQQQRRRGRVVTFEDFNNTTYYEPPTPILSLEDCHAIWYTAQELKTSFQDDIRVVVRHYMERVQQGKQPDDKNYIVSMHYCSPDNTTYSRGLDLLNPDEKNRRTRCDLYRSLVLKQYHALRASGMFSENHAMEMLQTFATEKSRWARTKATSIAATDAKQARQVYRDAFLAKEGVDQGLGILPSSSASKMRRSLRGGGQVQRKSDRARSA